MSSDNLHNESELLLQIAQGDELAFREIVVQYVPLLGPYIQNFTKSRERAQEIVQDVFVQVWMARETLVKVKDFRSFLFVISRNLALNAVRDLLREKARKAKWEMNVEYEEHETADEYTQERLTLIEEAVEHLAPQQRMAWILCRREGKTYAEAGAAMGISKETVKKYLQYAHASLIQYIEARIELAFLSIATTVFFV